ncbi:DUF5677 domain-containing protein [Hypericibacter sp.]|uniref:DUF5677 domain-containing protein n=1 Tax=Hypericibacter sp. TaxID=2705401 RepID=UPI003D6D3006
MSNPTYREAVLGLAEKLCDNAVRMIMEVELKVEAHGAADYKMVACALCGRSLANFKGVRLMVEEGLIIEARTLVRACYENMFFIAKLTSDGPAFVDKMLEDEIASRLKRAKFVLATSELLEGLLEETRKNLREYSEKAKTNFPKAKVLSPKSVSEDGPLSQAYLVYSQLSAEAAHPSFSSLTRHFSRIEENGKEIRVFDIQPVPRDTDLDRTLYLGCTALLGVLVGTSQILGDTLAGKELWGLLDEYTALGKTRVAAE